MGLDYPRTDLPIMNLNTNHTKMKIGYIIALILYVRLIFIDESKLSTILKVVITFSIVEFIFGLKYFQKKKM